MILAVSQSEVRVQTGFKPGFVLMTVERSAGIAIPLELTPGQTDQLIAMLQVAKRET